MQFATPPRWSVECGEKRAPFTLANGRRGAAGDSRERKTKWEWLKSTSDESESTPVAQVTGYSDRSQLFVIIFEDRSRLALSLIHI